VTGLVHIAYSASCHSQITDESTKHLQ